MKRLMVWGAAVTCVGAMSVMAGAAQGQAPAPAAPAAIDFSKVEITTTKFGSNFYAIDGSGGRMGALVGPDGVFVVDAQYAQLTDKLVAAINKVSGGAPIRLLVNTHVHPDHTGGDENFGKMGVTLLSRTNLRKRLAEPVAGTNGRPAMPHVALPIITYDAPLQIHMNGEDIQIIPLPPAHTDGDTAVKFPVADVLMTGDVFRSIGYPNIDLANGATLKGMLDALQVLADAAGPNTKVVPGHGDITNKAAIVAHREMAVTVRDRVAKLIQDGKTQEQAVAAKPTADFDAKVGNAAASADRFVTQTYTELKRTNATR
jgi:glyoxylase-like metal-dependent hydrolase (beta-lactamase superfamily II)